MSISMAIRGARGDQGMWGTCHLAALRSQNHPFPYALNCHLEERSGEEKSETGKFTVKLPQVLHQMKIPGLEWLYLFSYSILCGRGRSGRSELTTDKIKYTPPPTSLNVVWINLQPYENLIKRVNFLFSLLWFSLILGDISMEVW